jgi:chromate transporter
MSADAEAGAAPRAVDDAPRHPSFWSAFRFWLKLGFISFGGPAGQIAIMHEELVERRRWISGSRFLHALNYCMLLPGPEAQQLATYAGWLLHRAWGGIAAGALFVLPSVAILYALSWVYMTFGNVQWVAAVFYGLKPAVLAIVAAAVLRIGKKALKNEVMWLLAAAAFIAIYFFAAPFPLIVFSAGLLGLAGGCLGWRKFQVLAAHGAANDGPSVLHDAGAPPEHARPSWSRALRVLGLCLALWWMPVLALGAWLGWSHTVSLQGVFFSKAAMVTFGGAYAVLPYVSQLAVEKYEWLDSHQMLDGLGLAETTPGPLIMVLQFVGFVGAWNHPGDLSPLLAASLGAGVTTWTTFLPCFLWIFLGAPYIERLRGDVRLGAALSAVTASVTGVILNLAVWFAVPLLFPAPRTIDGFAAAISAVAFAGMVKWRWGVVPVVLGAGALGVVYRLVAPLQGSA